MHYTSLTLLVRWGSGTLLSTTDRPAAWQSKDSNQSKQASAHAHNHAHVLVSCRKPMHTQGQCPQHQRPLSLLRPCPETAATTTTCIAFCHAVHQGGWHAVVDVSSLLAGSGCKGTSTTVEHGMLNRQIGCGWIGLWLISMKQWCTLSALSEEDVLLRASAQVQRQAGQLLLLHLLCLLTSLTEVTVPVCTKTRSWSSVLHHSTLSVESPRV